MKKLIILLTIGCIFYACNETKKENNTGEMPMQPAQDSATSKIDFTKIVFASKKDTTCHMPLTAGVQDTFVADGKVYGFCSKECKDEFVKKLQVKR